MASGRRAQVYLDEDVPLPMADLLRNVGLTVHLPRGAGTLGAEDPIHLQTCASQGWVLITRNRRDFWRLHWMWMTLHHWGLMARPHSGILSIHEPGRRLTAQWAAAIAQFLSDQRRLPGLMYMWRPTTGQWDCQGVRFA